MGNKRLRGGWETGKEGESFMCDCGKLLSCIVKDARLNGTDVQLVELATTQSPSPELVVLPNVFSTLR